MPKGVKRRASVDIDTEVQSSSKSDEIVVNPRDLKDHESFAEKPRFYVWNERVEQAKAYHIMEKFHRENVVDRKNLDDPNYIEMRLKAAFINQLVKAEKKKVTHKMLKKSSATRSDIVKDSCYSVNDGKRLMLVKNLSQANPDPVDLKVFCDLNMVSSDHIFTQNFRYIEDNDYGPFNQDERFQLILKCDCDGVCEPKTCACLKAQKKAFPEVEHAGAGYVTDTKNYFEDKAVLNMYENALIMCGPECKCDPKSCGNHIERLKVPHTLEVFRTNKYVGFGIRTLNDIQMDQVVSEFKGMIAGAKPKTTGLEIWDERHEQYAMDYACSDISYILEQLEKATEVTADKWKFFEEKVKKADPVHVAQRRGSKKRKNGKKVEDDQPSALLDYKILPYLSGNVSRFVGHGCTPNLTMIRVIVNRLHPIFHRVFFKALHPITRGTELFINYGVDYRNKHDFDCSCGTIMCDGRENKLKKAYFDKLNATEMLRVLFDRRMSHQNVINNSPMDFVGTDAKTGLRPREQVLGSEQPDPEIYAESEDIRERNKKYNNSYVGQLEQENKSEYDLRYHKWMEEEGIEEEMPEEEDDKEENVIPPPLYALPPKKYFTC